MGEYRKNEILKQGGKPIDEETMTPEEIFDAGFKAYKDAGENHPLVEKIVNKVKKENDKK